MAHVHEAPPIEAGSTSVTVAPLTSAGPRFDTVTVYDTAVPGVSVPAPSVFVTARSLSGASRSVSVALSFPGTGSLTPTGTAALAVFDSDPVADGDTTPLIVKAADALGARSSVVATALPAPSGLPQAPIPAAIEHVHETAVIVAGTVSAKDAPATKEGPRFVTITV